MPETSSVGVFSMYYVMWVLIPLWVLTGFADYFCHRRSRIQETSGTKESLIHMIMLVEVGLPIMMGLFMEVNSLVLIIMMLAFLAHSVTAVWDVVYTEEWRVISHAENILHNFLMVLPFMVVSFMICFHWPQFLAIFGAGPESASFALELRHDPLPHNYPVYALGFVSLFLALPYAEEFVRCLRSSRGQARPAQAKPLPPGAVHPAV